MCGALWRVRGSACHRCCSCLYGAIAAWHDSLCSLSLVLFLVVLSLVSSILLLFVISFAVTCIVCLAVTCVITLAIVLMLSPVLSLYKAFKLMVTYIPNAVWYLTNEDLCQNILLWLHTRLFTSHPRQDTTLALASVTSAYAEVQYYTRTVHECALLLHQAYSTVRIAVSRFFQSLNS